MDRRQREELVRAGKSFCLGTASAAGTEDSPARVSRARKSNIAKRANARLALYSAPFEIHLFTRKYRAKKTQGMGNRVPNAVTQGDVEPTSRGQKTLKHEGLR